MQIRSEFAAWFPKKASLTVRWDEGNLTNVIFIAPEGYEVDVQRRPLGEYRVMVHYRQCPRHVVGGFCEFCCYTWLTGNLD